MHPTLLPRPIHKDGWVYEEKVDGWRMLAFKDAGRVRLISRAGRDHTKRFQQIVDALTDLQPDAFTLDGEVAVFDRELVSRFEWLRHLTQGDLATPPLYMVFDLLQMGEQDYRAEPLRIRWQALEKLVKRQALILPARRLSPNGFAAWTEVLHRGWEGYVAKDPESPYIGGRTLKWLKVKQAEYWVEERGWSQP
jgi:bifunctional non-homologous end joining protein LigD